MSSGSPSYGQVDREYAIRLATASESEDGPIWMVNLMKYREVADYADGVRGGISGRDADNLYSPIDVLVEIGAEVVFVADVEQQLLGDAPVWDRVAVVRYPTRRSFIDMQSRQDFRDKHVHKEAGMDTTIVIGCVPMSAQQGQPVDWADVAHPPSEADEPVVVLHVLRYDDASAAGATPDEMVDYQSAAAAVARPHGVRVNGWFSAEGTILGDGRAWDQVRFNEFPSKAAFMAVVAEPARLEAQRNSREVAIADTYTMILRPTVNRLAPSIADVR